MHHGSVAACAIGHRPIARNRQVRYVSGFEKRGQQIEQATLRAAGLIELIQDEQASAHQAAIASAQKYRGSTRQYVNRSPESIWKSWPIQKQKIQLPKNEARE